MKINRLSIFIILVTALSGCVSVESTVSLTGKLQLGMTKEQVIEIMGKPEVVASPPASETLHYYFTKITGDDVADEFGQQARDNIAASPMSSSRVRSPRLYRLQLAENRLVAFGIGAELESEKPIPFKAIELGVPNDNHWKSYGIKTKDLKLGMTKEELIGVLGQPDSFGANHQFEYLNFLRHSNGQGSDKRFRLRAYIARFVDGRLERFWCEYL